MIVKVNSNTLAGTIPAIPSKSYAHRMLICAAFSRRPCRIRCTSASEDILATIRCLNAMGASIVYENGMLQVTPVDREHLPEYAEMDCGESGSTLRFLLPVACALGLQGAFIMHGRLSQRPLSPLYEELCTHGASLSPQGEQPFRVGGRLTDPEFSIAANVSSQFISGLLFALPLMGGGRIRMTGEVQSGSYLDITVECLRLAGIDVQQEDNIFTVQGTYAMPEESVVQGDWSNAAFWLCAGALSDGAVTVTGLKPDSAQGDRKIMDVLRRFGAEVSVSQDSVTVSANALSGIVLDASDIPDLVPVISAVAAKAEGETRIEHAERLRIKESDRIQSVCALLKAFGADHVEMDDGIRIRGGRPLHGATVSSCNDHRIAMTAAVMTLLTDSAIIIEQAESVNKSYPSFYEDFRTLGGEEEELQ